MWLTGSSWSETAHKISRATASFASPPYPKETKGWDFILCVPKKPQVWGASVAGSQFCDWVPSSQVLTLLCFPLIAVLPGGDPVQENHNVTSHWQPPQHSRSEFTWECQYLPGFFIYSLKHQSRNQADQKNKRSNLEAVFTWLNKSQMITLTVPSSGLVKGREHQP